MTVTPFKTDSPLIVDPYTPLSFTVPAQFLQSISRGYSQIVQFVRTVKISQFPQRGVLDITRQPGGKASAGYLLSFFTPKRTDQNGPFLQEIVTLNVTIVNL
jgi:hypothetical protein